MEFEKIFEYYDGEDKEEYIKYYKEMVDKVERFKDIEMEYIDKIKKIRNENERLRDEYRKAFFEKIDEKEEKGEKGEDTEEKEITIDDLFKEE